MLYGTIELLSIPRDLLMYGSQLEIQRIQSKLRQIGQTHPYRAVEESALPERSHSSILNDTPPDPQLMGARPPSPIVSRRTTADLYKSVAGRQARLAMAQVSPVLGVATQRSSAAKMPDLPSVPPPSVSPLPVPPPSVVSPSTSSQPIAPSPVSQTASRVMAYQTASELATQLRQQYSTQSSAVDLHSAHPYPRSQGIQGEWSSGRSPTSQAHGFSRANALAAIWAAIAAKGQHWWPDRGRSSAHDPQNNRTVAHGVASPSTAVTRPKRTRRFLLPQAVRWFVGAMVVRVLIDGLLLVFPSLQLVVMTVVLTPVAIALYQTTVNPQGSVHSGRRLLVVMMGLLMGGQL